MGLTFRQQTANSYRDDGVPRIEQINSELATVQNEATVVQTEEISINSCNLALKIYNHLHFCHQHDHTSERVMLPWQHASLCKGPRF